MFSKQQTEGFIKIGWRPYKGGFDYSLHWCSYPFCINCININKSKRDERHFGMFGEIEFKTEEKK